MKNNSPPLLKRLDAPMRFCSFSMNDLAAFLAPLFLGALCDSILIVPLIGGALVFAMKKIVKRFPKFYPIRCLYWSLPTGTVNRALRTNMPPSHKRLWVK